MFFIFGGAILSFSTVWLWKGQSEALTEAPSIMTGLAGAIGPIVLLFLWNLICAPYRIEASNRILAEQERDTAVADLENAKKSIPPGFRQIDENEMWNASGVVGHALEQVGITPDRTTLIFPRLSMKSDIVNDNTYYFRDLELKYVQSGFEVSADLAGAVSRALVKGQFKIVRKFPTYVDMRLNTGDDQRLQ